MSWGSAAGAGWCGKQQSWCRRRGCCMGNHGIVTTAQQPLALFGRVAILSLTWVLPHKRKRLAAWPKRKALREPRQQCHCCPCKHCCSNVRAGTHSAVSAEGPEGYVGMSRVHFTANSRSLTIATLNTPSTPRCTPYRPMQTKLYLLQSRWSALLQRACSA